jgi:hypothetical protein
MNFFIIQLLYVGSRTLDLCQFFERLAVIRGYCVHQNIDPCVFTLTLVLVPTRYFTVCYFCTKVSKKEVLTVRYLEYFVGTERGDSFMEANLLILSYNSVV